MFACMSVFGRFSLSYIGKMMTFERLTNTKTIHSFTILFQPHHIGEWKSRARAPKAELALITCAFCSKPFSLPKFWSSARAISETNTSLYLDQKPHIKGFFRRVEILFLKKKKRPGRDLNPGRAGDSRLY